MPREFAGYAIDDDGELARKVWLIRDGILRRPLGGALSRLRAAARGGVLGGVSGHHVVERLGAPAGEQGERLEQLGFALV